MENFKVTIVTPCYNIRNIDSNKMGLFKSMIDSVKNQTFGYENIEHILINNGSTDDTSSLLSNLSNKYNNIKILSIDKNTGGPSIPRNMGIKNATTKYIMFLDADDILQKDCVEILYNEIESENVDLVNSNYLSFDGKKTLKHISNNQDRVILEPKSPDMNQVLLFIAGAIYRTDFLINENVKFFNVPSEDVCFLVDCILKTNKNIIVLNGYYGLIYTSDNNTSLSHSLTLKQIEGYIKSYNLNIENCIKYKQNQKFISEFYLDSVYVLIGAILRSKETKDNKKIMFDIIKGYLIKHENINLKLNWYWYTIYKLILSNHKYTVIYISSFVQKVFDQKWFVKYFRNQFFTE